MKYVWIVVCAITLLSNCASYQSQYDKPDPKTNAETPAPESVSTATPPPPMDMTSDTEVMMSEHEIPSDDRLVSGTLSNGMKYYIQKNVKPENRAELRLAVNAGSVLEDEDQKGLAHFVEHMAFNGTEHFDENELIDYLESVGTRFGPDLNAYTSFDETVYMLQVRTDSTELFDKGMLILRDWAAGVTFDHVEIDKERGVIESEWRSRLSPDQRMQQVTFPIMYQGSQYAERLPIGDTAVIRNSAYDALKRYYRDWYRPDLMAVVVVGDVDVAEIEAQVKTLFGDIPASTNPRERTMYNVPFHDETLVGIASDKEASFTNVNIMYKHPKQYTKSLDDYRMSLVRSLYNSMLGARLQEISKQPDPPFMFAFSGYGGDVGDLDTYTAGAFVPEGKAPDALTALLSENERILQHGFTSGELERAKANTMQRAERNLKEMDKTESNRIVMRYVYKYLDDIPTPGPQQTIELYQKYLPTIQLEEVNALPSKWIKDDSRVVIITGPEKEETPLPTEADVMSILASVDGKAIDPYVDEVASEPFFTKQLTATPIAESKTIEHVDVDYIKLANGVQVYLKQTDFKNDEILMRASSPGGHSLYPDAEYFNAGQSASIMAEGGLGAFSTTAMQKMMAGKTVSVRPYVGSYAEGFNGSCSPDDLEIMFQMIHKYFYDTRIDDEAFASYITRQQGIYKNLMSNPNYFFNDYVSKYRFDNHPRVGFPKESDWTNLDYAKAQKIYKERFADAGDFVFSFVGNFDEAKILEYIQKYLGDLPSTGREETWQDTGLRPKAGVHMDRFKKGEAPKTNVSMYYHGPFEYNDANNYLIESTLAYLRIKLREKLREDLGGVYGVRVSGGGNKKPIERYGISVSFNADPPMTDQLVAAAKEVIKTAAMEGPDATDMVKVQETQRQNRVKSLQENRFWMNQLMGEHEEGATYDDVTLEDYEKMVSNLTSDQIKMAIAKYFDPSRYIEIIMDPEVAPEGGE